LRFNNVYLPTGEGSNIIEHIGTDAIVLGIPKKKRKS